MPTPAGKCSSESPSAFCEPPTSLVIDQPLVGPSEQSNTPDVSTGVPSSFAVGIAVYGVWYKSTWWLPDEKSISSRLTHESGTVTNLQCSTSVPGAIVVVISR